MLAKILIVFVLCCLIIGITGIWIYNLYQDIKFFEDEVSLLTRIDKTFVVVKYEREKQRTLQAKTEIIKLAPKESYDFRVNYGYELLGFSIQREN